MEFLTPKDYLTVETLHKDLVGEYAVFYISGGRKYYITKVYKDDLRVSEAVACKHSDDRTLKVTKTFGEKLLEKKYFTQQGLTDKEGKEIKL